MKDLADALVGGSGWLQNPETVDCKRVEKHLDEEANLDYEDDDEGDDGAEGDGYSTDDSDSEFDLDLDSESELSDSDPDPGVCQDAAVQWLDALHPVIVGRYRLLLICAPSIKGSLHLAVIPGT
ncbi:hypothetical protein FBULB1_12853 [Fusarium bulbicola]|nr:hypothetical protein FBULB1_12853 [Fusarium bulbicola]